MKYKLINWIYVTKQVYIYIFTYMITYVNWIQIRIQMHPNVYGRTMKTPYSEDVNRCDSAIWEETKPKLHRLQPLKPNCLFTQHAYSRTVLQTLQLQSQWHASSECNPRFDKICQDFLRMLGVRKAQANQHLADLCLKNADLCLKGWFMADVWLTFHGFSAFSPKKSAPQPPGRRVKRRSSPRCRKDLVDAERISGISGLITLWIFNIAMV